MNRRNRAYIALFLYFIVLILNISSITIGIYKTNITEAMGKFATAIYPASVSFFVVFVFLIFQGIFFLRLFNIIKWKDPDEYLIKKSINTLIIINLCNIFYLIFFHTHHNFLSFLIASTEVTFIYLMVFYLSKLDIDTKRRMMETNFMFVWFLPFTIFLAGSQLAAILLGIEAFSGYFVEAIINTVGLLVSGFWILFCSQNSDGRIYYTSSLFVLSGILIRIVLRLGLERYHIYTAIVVVIFIFINVLLLFNSFKKEYMKKNHKKKFTERFFRR